MTKAIDELMERIRDELSPVDVDKSYDDFLDECYSFESVGVIFKYMLPSRVLREMDPVAYRCGFNDWLDGEDLIDVGVGCDEYYLLRDMEQVRDDLVGELEGDRDSLQEEIDDLDPCETEEIATLEEEIFILEQKIKEIKDHTF